MSFRPAKGYVEVEVLSNESIIQSDSKSYVEKGKVLQNGEGVEIGIGDIIFFRPHGCFETAEHEGEKHHVVRVDPEFILGKYENEDNKEIVFHEGKGNCGECCSVCGNCRYGT